MSVHERNGKWLVVYRVRVKDRLVKKHETYGTKEEAQFRDELIKEAKRKKLSIPLRDDIDSIEKISRSQDENISKLRYETIVTRWQGSKSEATALKNSMDVVRYFGEDRLVKTIKTSDIYEMIKYFETEKRNSNGTINRKLAALSTMLTHAYDMEWIDRKPKITKLKEPKGRIRWLNYDEEKIVLDFFKIYDEDMCDFVSLAIETGGRLSELLKLRSKDLKRIAPELKLMFGFDYSLLFWETKNSEDREVPLTDIAYEIIQRRRRGCDSEDDLLFSGMTKSSVQKRWDLMRYNLGYDVDKQFTFHMTRHTCCTRLVMANNPLASVMKWMGHNEVKTTMRYTHLDERSLGNAKNRIEDLRKKYEAIDLSSPMSCKNPSMSGHNVYNFDYSKKVI